VLEQSNAYWFVLCPDGSRGWLHRMTLGERVSEDEEEADEESGTGAFATPDVDDDVLAAYLASRRTA
jgi:hypothetical protein